MMNRILKRPMFRRGGSAGTGITSGLDKPRQEYSVAGRVTEGIDPYISDVEKVFQARDVVPNLGGLSPGTLPGFLTSFGLNLASATPTGTGFGGVALAIMSLCRPGDEILVSDNVYGPTKEISEKLLKEFISVILLTE